MNLNQPVILSKMEWERGFKAYGTLEKTYDDYVESAVKSIKWEPGMLAWDVFEKKMCVWKKEYDKISYNSAVWQPPTEEQLRDYKAIAEDESDPANTCTQFTTSPVKMMRQLAELSDKHKKEPDKKPFIKAGDVVWNSGLKVCGKIIRFVSNGAEIVLNNGNSIIWTYEEFAPASPAQIAEYYTMTVKNKEGNPTRWRLYKPCKTIPYHIFVKHENEDLSHWANTFECLLINQHYKHLVLTVDDVEEMVPPVSKGKEPEDEV